jgi:hypothetical protein
MMGAAFFLLTLCTAPSLVAQDTIPRPRPDTTAADTVIVRPDTIPLRVAATDTIRPAPRFPAFRDPRAEGWSAGVWVFDEVALQAHPFFTLADLLERIPGVTAIRAGMLGQPEGVGGWGWGGGRIDLYLDGFLLDPLDGAAIDLARIELVGVQRVRVERRPDRLRIELFTQEAMQARPYSRVEAGTGDFRTDMLRGLVVVPRFGVGPFAAGVERLASEGVRRTTPANTFGAWAKWAATTERAGLQVEARRQEVERTGGSPFPGRVRRTDWVLRARARPFAPLLAEAFYGASLVEDDAPLPDDPDRVVERRAPQYGGRLEWALAERAHLRAGVRMRPDAPLPASEQLLDLALYPLAGLVLEGELRRDAWNGGSARGSALRARAEPFPWLALFGEWAGGRAAAPARADTVTVPLVTDRSGTRAGVLLAGRGFRAGVAALRLATDSVLTYGLAFDAPVRAQPGGTTPGIEVAARVPLFLRGLGAEAEYTYWFGDDWLYRPVEIVRARLVYHDVPLASGNLEVLSWIEGTFRGPYLVGTPVGGLAQVPHFQRFDFYLQLRVLDVRAFIRWENMLLRPDLQDLPGLVFPRQRAIYGVRWQFWN